MVDSSLTVGSAGFESAFKLRRYAVEETPVITRSEIANAAGSPRRWAALHVLTTSILSPYPE